MDKDSAVDNDSEAVRRAEAEDDPLFPTDGNFSRVVPLTQAGDEVVPIAEADDEPARSDEAAPSVAAVAQGGTDEREEEVATLVPARTSRGTSPVQVSRPKKGFAQSWGFTAVVLAVSILAGAAAGAYIISSQSASETPRPDASNVEAADAAVNRDAEKVIASQPAEQPVPQAPAPQAEHDKLAAANAPALTPNAPAASDEANADAKAESVNPPTPSTKATARAADTAARRTLEPEPRAERTARAASEARDASSPRLTPGDAAPHRAERPTPANATASERSLPISSPPPSARPKKVIQWP
ncbi:MAG TPA: hypothetical protein VJ866_24685 [Pyrinomonadaceae bacterium]|nr:hypothetical protein [Pyrinomonadaceae bacterium]